MPEYGERVWFIRPRLHRFSHERNGIQYAMCGAFAAVVKPATKRRRKRYLSDALRGLALCPACFKGDTG